MASATLQSFFKDGVDVCDQCGSGGRDATGGRQGAFELRPGLIASTQALQYFTVKKASSDRFVRTLVHQRRIHGHGLPRQICSTFVSAAGMRDFSFHGKRKGRIRMGIAMSPLRFGQCIVDERARFDEAPARD